METSRCSNKYPVDYTKISIIEQNMMSALLKHSNYGHLQLVITLLLMMFLFNQIAIIPTIGVLSYGLFLFVNIFALHQFDGWTFARCHRGMSKSSSLV